MSKSSKVTGVNVINDPLAFIRSGLEDVLAGQNTSGLGTQRAAAGILSLAGAVTEGVLGWAYEVDSVARTITPNTLKHAFQVWAKGEDDDAIKAAIKALREAVIGTNPLAVSKEKQARDVSNKAVTEASKFKAKGTAFRDAWLLACRLSNDGYSMANYTEQGFRIMKGDIAPTVMVDKAKKVLAPFTGSPDDAIVLNPATASAFALIVDGDVKVLKSVRHSVASYMSNGKAAGSKVTGTTLLKSADFLVKNLKATDNYNADTMSKLNALAAVLANVINARASRDAANEKDSKAA